MTPRDYLELSAKTLSPNLHNKNANSAKLLIDLRFFTRDAEVLDNYKKALYYNKIVNSQLAEEADRFPLCIEAPDADYLHAVLGIASEAGEIVEAFTKWRWRLVSDTLYDKQAVRPNVTEELGDLMWYVALLCRHFDLSLEEVFEKNITKLRLRYGDKFSESAAESRDLVSEAKVFD